MQGEDDVRGLAKIMAFMRAVSILIVLMHLYSVTAFFLKEDVHWKSSIRYWAISNGRLVCFHIRFTPKYLQ